MHPAGRHLVLLLVSSALVAVASAEQLWPVVDLEPVKDKWSNHFHVHVVNGLSNSILFVECKSKDTDIGQHFLDLEAEIAWGFFVNVWGTTRFWCAFAKPGAQVSHEVFWPERHSTWLRDRCSARLSCVWIAKDEGIYLRNIDANVDELIRKWNDFTNS